MNVAERNLFKNNELLYFEIYNLQFVKLLSMICEGDYTYFYLCVYYQYLYKWFNWNISEKNSLKIDKALRDIELLCQG